MMISYYFSPSLGITEWNRDIFLNVFCGRVQTLRHYICENPFLFAPLVVQKTEGNRKLDNDIDFLIKFERLNHDFKIVCKKLEIQYSPLPKTNSSVREHYSKYYDEELKEIVRNKFAEEIEFGNYSFESS